MHIYSLSSPQRCWFSACRDVTGEVWHADEVLAAQLLSAQLLFPRSAGNHSGDGDSDGSGRWSAVVRCWSVVWKLETFSSQTRAHQPRPSTALVGMSMTLNNVHIYKTWVLDHGHNARY